MRATSKSWPWLRQPAVPAGPCYGSWFWEQRTRDSVTWDVGGGQGRSALQRQVDAQQHAVSRVYLQVQGRVRLYADRLPDVQVSR